MALLKQFELEEKRIKSAPLASTELSRENDTVL
jgi:hypothetical protein